MPALLIQTLAEEVQVYASHVNCIEHVYTYIFARGHSDVLGKEIGISITNISKGAKAVCGMQLDWDCVVSGLFQVVPQQFMKPCPYDVSERYLK